MSMDDVGLDELEGHLDDEVANEGSGRHLTFQLAGQVYGIELRRVREIVRAQRATPVPDVPDYVLGVMNLRGTVVPVVDARRRMGIQAREADERTCVIVCSYEGEGVGVVVDTVCDVIDVDEADVVEARSEVSTRNAMIRGLVRTTAGVRILLCLDRLLERQARSDESVAA
ncbi:MAG: purine-binding chemotaxis protein CheW [Spirochaetaceae bacterium]|nr:purine-binding chemotaxis protein CheW [Spirochaetaceae bacterium]